MQLKAVVIRLPTFSREGGGEQRCQHRDGEQGLQWADGKFHDDDDESDAARVDYDEPNGKWVNTRCTNGHGEDKHI